tara:strand:+ start:577 stop:951 length:375 start_codon:yes stop_codon:yes gene_type:complete
MSKLYDCDGFCVHGAFKAATKCVAQDGKVYPIREGSLIALNEAQQLHLDGSINVHDKCYDWKPVKRSEKPTGKGALQIFPSIAQQWKNQMKGIYTRPKTFITQDPNDLNSTERARILDSFLNKH